MLGSRRDLASVADDANATALAIFAWMPERPRAARTAAGRLLRVQIPSGGFGYRPGVSADVDTTGLCAWALARAGHRAAARRAAGFVGAAQNPDGGFPSLPGGDSNSQSTGLALAALRVAGLGPRPRYGGIGPTPLAYLAGLARRHGSIAYSATSAPTPAWTTAQALLGLTAARALLRR